MRIPALLAALALAAPAFAASEGKPGPFTHTLKPGDIVEDCVKLKAGQSREFSWTSDAPVDFNIHWHEGEKVEYGAQLQKSWKGKGRFTAARDQDYCWMWTGRKDNGAVVIGDFRAVAN
jgi:hypothetical protein